MYIGVLLNDDYVWSCETRNVQNDTTESSDLTYVQYCDTVWLVFRGSLYKPREKLFSQLFCNSHYSPREIAAIL